MMAFFDGLLDAIQPYVGVVFITLLLLLLFLSAIYWVLLTKKRKEDFHPPKSRESEIFKGGVGISTSSVAQAAPPPAPPPEVLASDTPPRASAPAALMSPPTAIQSGERSQRIETVSELAAKLSKVRHAIRGRASSTIVPENVENLLAAGKSAMVETRWEQARKYFEEALKQSPQNIDVFVKLAIVCYEMQDLPMAEKYYNDAIQLHPSAGKAFRQHVAYRV